MSGARPDPGRRDRVVVSAVVVRTATGNDLDAVLDIGHRTWRATYEPIAGPDYVAMGLAKWWTSDVVIDSIRLGRTLVAERDGDVVGLAAYGLRGDDLVLWKLYVPPEHQGGGVGRALLDAVLRRGEELGRARVVLSHLADNEQAGRFYARNGFVRTDVESGGSGVPDSVWVARDLGATPQPEEQP
ncbi:MAG TPA: GNAT family N-acetyltransferase [Intrasporangium sp.]|uniref:GNAT family N-acetyltransferase n=1 Tax=Intrasporangium sp. TaxID=1925024 RepID=UPI002D780F3A|nr:GNAT family N-acetyltransferase [Intrasporangium sp.]HET7397894.1 GNAT family N-acetyltransferase [Intrasporangium sp.]